MDLCGGAEDKSRRLVDESNDSPFYLPEVILAHPFLLHTKQREKTSPPLLAPHNTEKKTLSAVLQLPKNLAKQTHKLKDRSIQNIMSTNIAASPMEGGEEMEAVNALMVCREEIEQMKGEVAEVAAKMESMLVSFGSGAIVSFGSFVSRLASLVEETVKVQRDEIQRLLACNGHLETELRQQKRVDVAYQSSTEHQASLSHQKSSYQQVPSLLGGINYQAEDDEPEQSAAPTNTSSEQGNGSFISSPQSKCTSNRKRKSSLEQDPSRKEVVNKKKCRPKCSVDGCTNEAQKSGVCIRHGAKRKKRCSSEGCTNQAYIGGVCMRHGAKRKKRCSSEGCTNQAVKGGVCKRHGAKVKRCSSAGCTSVAKRRGVCIKHGGKRKCSMEGCTKHVVQGGVCWKHGVRRRHGAYAYHNAQDESTAFGSEDEQTTASRTLLNSKRPSRSALNEQEECTNVPGEVTILCQYVAEL